MSGPLPSSAQPITSVSGGAGYLTPVWQRWFNSLLDGGTGSLTPADIGVTVQAYSPNLDAWSVVIPSSFLTNAAAAANYLTIADAASSYQPLSANLTAWSAVVPASFLTVATAAATYLTIASAAASYQPLSANLTSWSAVVPASFLTTATAAATYLTIATAAVTYQPLSANLTAWAAFNTNGLLTQTAPGTYTGRALNGPASGIAVSNGSGVAGNPTLALSDDLAALEALTGTNTIYYRSGASAWTAVTIATNLGFTTGTLGSALGNAATQNTGTSGGNIPFMNGANTWANVNTFAGGAPILGVATNSNAAAGYIGEYVSSTVTAGAPVALVTATAKTMTSISLTAGDWAVRLSLSYVLAATTNITALVGSLSLVNNTVDTAEGRQLRQFFTAYVPGGDMRGYYLEMRFSLASTTTIYAIAQANFTLSTASACGILSATRTR